MTNNNAVPAGTHDVLLDDTARFVHTHDDARSVVVTDGGGVHGGPGKYRSAAQTAQPVVTECPEMAALRGRRGLSRRRVLQGAGLGAVLAASPFNRYVFAEQRAFAAGAGQGGHTLVCVFMRGGMDGLGAVIPLGDSRYQTLRPTLGLNDSTVLPLPGGRFGLHPAMPKLRGLIGAGQAAVVHATGHPNTSRSHFDKQFFHELGAAEATMHTGWVGRYLASTGTMSTFRAVTMGATAAFMMTNPSPTLAISNLGDFNVKAPTAAVRDEVLADVKTMWGGIGGDAEAAMSATIDAAMTASKMAAAAPSVTYPNNELGNRLKQVAQIIKAGVGLEVACVDSQGWDMHGNLGTPTTGLLAPKLAEVDGALAAFWADLGSLTANVTVLTMSEFGRTAAVNSSGGADHGYGGVMFALSAGVKGGVAGAWPTLAASAMNGNDLAIANDYRDSVADILTRKMGVTASQLGQVLPGYTPKPSGLFA